MTVRIYDDGPRAHDARAPGGRGDFDRAVAAVRAGEEVLIPVDLSTFHRLPKLLRFVAALKGGDLPDLPDFHVAAAPKLVEGLHEHRKALRVRLKGLSLAPGDIDPALLEVLEEFDRRSRPGTRPDLLRLLGVLSDAVFIGPHTFHMDITNECNTNCTFCGLHSPLLIEPRKPMPGRRFTEGWKGARRRWEEFVNLVDDLDRIGCREDILFNGEGEPLMHPRAHEMIRLICAKDMKLTLFTNGLAIKDRAIDLLVGCDTHMLYWSLHAADKETFHRMQPARKPEDFPKMVRNMRKLVRAKRAKNNKPHIVAAMVINVDNFRSCEKFMELCLHVGVDSVRYQIMHSCTSTESLLLNRDQFTVAHAGVEKAKMLAQRRGIQVVGNIDFQMESCERTYDKAVDVLSCHWSHDRYRQSGCLVGWFFSRSFSDGLVSFCCHDKIVGSLKRGSFFDLWHSEAYRRARKAGKAFDPRYNIDLSEAGCGGLLLDEDCSWCGNYEFINRGLEDLERLGWRARMNRTPP